jgi:hypothetical protein
METTVYNNEGFLTLEVCGAKIGYGTIDKDYIIRFTDDYDERIISARTLHRELTDRNKSHLFSKMIERAYKENDDTTIKLRSGIRVGFCSR